MIDPPPTADISVPPVTCIGGVAPDFEARSTCGVVKLSGYRGRWLVFFSHPADFTPVCTSEFVAFQGAMKEFDARDCSLLGLSVDSLFAHIAWIKDIERRFKVKITFPIVEDISMSIARAYGMIHGGSTTTATVRSVFFIDPEGYIRASIHYPMNVGRAVAEIMRVLSALQEADAHAVAIPEGWRPGDRAVLPPPVSQTEADKRVCGGDDAWYFTYTGDDL